MPYEYRMTRKQLRCCFLLIAEFRLRLILQLAVWPVQKNRVVRLVVKSVHLNWSTIVLEDL
jgi:hypothetical protein